MLLQTFYSQLQTNNISSTAQLMNTLRIPTTFLQTYKTQINIYYIMISESGKKVCKSKDTKSEVENYVVSSETRSLKVVPDLWEYEGLRVSVLSLVRIL